MNFHQVRLTYTAELIQYEFFISTPFHVASGDTLENHCRALEVAFAKSYVHGLFDSLQAGDYIHKNDVQEAIRLCRETKIEINLSSFIQVIPKLGL